MFNEEIILNNCEDEEFTSAVIKVFYDNLGLTNTMLSKYHYVSIEYDDLFQLAWDSFKKAVDVWVTQQQRYPLQAYYRTCLKHTIYKETQELLKYENAIDRTTEPALKGYYRWDQDVLDYELWVVVRRLLSKRNFEIIVQRFYYEKTLKEIGDYYNVSYETIRKSLKRSCNLLKNDKDVQDIGRLSGYIIR